MHGSMCCGTIGLGLRELDHQLLLGGTEFSRLGITVRPKKGRAVLWPQVYNSVPMEMDSRFAHQALPVEEGTKYAFNCWIHMYDFVTAVSKGCH